MTPNSSANKIGDVFYDEKNQEYLKINIAAIPDDDEANDELVKFLSKIFKIPKSKISIIRGNSSRTKSVRIDDDFTNKNYTSILRITGQ